jgi:hypothetical protein
VEFRYHGSLLTRVVPRFEESSNGDKRFGGRLCVKGRFEHAFLNDSLLALPRDGKDKEISWQQAADQVEEALKDSRRTVMRLSPYLPGEILDRALTFARDRGISVEAAGLQRLDPGWVALIDATQAASQRNYLFEDGQQGTEGRLLLIVGGLAETNNVAFTDCLAIARERNFSLWQVGELNPVYKRYFDRSLNDPGTLSAVLKEAQRAGTDRVEVLLNPEQILNSLGKQKEKAIVQALQSALVENAENVTGMAKLYLTLFWNSRNAAYLLRSLNGINRSKTKVDLLLEVGPEPQFHNSERPDTAEGDVRTIRWGWHRDGAELLIPLDRSIWFSGYSELSGRASRRAGMPSREAFKNFIIG